MRINVIILIFVLASLSLYGQNGPDKLKKLTFEEALGLSLQNNHLVKQYQHQSLRLEQEMKAAKSLHLPGISLNATYAMMSGNLELDLTPVRDALSPLYSTLGHYGKFGGVPNPDPKTNGLMPFLSDEISTTLVRRKMNEGLETVNNAEWIKTIQEKNFGMVNAGFVFPLFTGGKINVANKAAKIRLEASEIETIQKANELTGELTERYFGLLLANEAVKVRMDVKTGMQKHLDDAQRLAEQGMIAHVEVLNAKVYYADAERELKKAERQVEILNEAVLNTIAETGEIKIIPSSSLFYIPNIGPPDFFKQKAKENNPLLVQVSKKRELAQQGIKAEQAAYLPAVAATGTFDLVNKDLSPYLPDYMVGIGLQWKLFDGNARKRKVKAARFQEMEAEDFYLKAASDIQSAITRYYQELQMHLDQITELDAAMQFTDEYSRARGKAFSEGMATTTQVSDANLAVAKVKIERLQAIYSWEVALSKLLYYSGQSDRFVSYMSQSDAQQVQYQAIGDSLGKGGRPIQKD